MRTEYGEQSTVAVWARAPTKIAGVCFVGARAQPALYNYRIQSYFMTNKDFSGNCSRHKRTGLSLMLIL
jgi:hypothetical protein